MRYPVLIHIGYHKTVTSWLQSFLFSEPSSGFYPLGLLNGESFKPGSKRLSKQFAGYFVRDDRQFLSPFEDRSKEFLEKIDNVNIPEGKVGVISNERLCGSIYSGGIESRDIADRIKNALPDARIFICIREQVDIILSCYFQYLKSGGNGLSLKDFINQSYDLLKPGFSIKKFRYDGLISYYQRIFGKENVLVLPYEMFVSEPDKYVNRILEHCELPHVGELPYKRRKNSQELKVKIAKYYLNYFDVSVAGKNIIRVPGVFVYALSRALSYSFSKKKMAKLRRYIEGEVSGYYEESNERASRLIDIDLKHKYNYK